MLISKQLWLLFFRHNIDSTKYSYYVLILIWFIVFSNISVAFYNRDKLWICSNTISSDETKMPREINWMTTQKSLNRCTKTLSEMRWRMHSHKWREKWDFKLLGKNFLLCIAPSFGNLVFYSIENKFIARNATNKITIFLFYIQKHSILAASMRTYWLHERMWFKG